MPGGSSSSSSSPVAGSTLSPAPGGNPRLILVKSMQEFSATRARPRPSSRRKDQAGQGGGGGDWYCGVYVQLRSGEGGPASVLLCLVSAVLWWWWWCGVWCVVEPWRHTAATSGQVVASGLTYTSQSTVTRRAGQGQVTCLARVTGPEVSLGSRGRLPSWPGCLAARQGGEQTTEEHSVSKGRI